MDDPPSADEPVERVVVIGQGYVGLPLAVRAAEQGYAVVTYDPARVAPEALVPVIDDLGYRATVAR